MSRKWSVFGFGIVATAFALSAVGLSIASDDEGPIHKKMEQVGKTNGALKKALRTPASFKKAGPEVVKNGDQLIKLMKEVREEKDPAKKVKKPQSAWESAVDDMVAATETFNKAAETGKHKDAQAAYRVMGSKCAACHKVFKVEEDE